MKKMVTIFIILILAVTSIPLVSNAEKINAENSPVECLEGEKELDLLRGEHVLVLKAKDDTDSFNVRYAFQLLGSCKK